MGIWPSGTGRSDPDVGSEIRDLSHVVDVSSSCFMSWIGSVSVLKTFVSPRRSVGAAMELVARLALRNKAGRMSKSFWAGYSVT